MPRQCHHWHPRTHRASAALRGVSGKAPRLRRRLLHAHGEASHGSSISADGAAARPSTACLAARRSPLCGMAGDIFNTYILYYIIYTISRGDVPAHCRGFGTCGWTDVGGTSTRTKIVDPLPWRHGPRYTCQGHGLSGQSVVPPRLSGKSGCFGPSRLGYPSPGSVTCHPRRKGRPAGWTKSPGTNLPTT